VTFANNTQVIQVTSVSTFETQYEIINKSIYKVTPAIANAISLHLLNYLFVYL